MRALELILAGPAISQVFATPLPLSGLIGDLLRSAEGSGVARAERVRPARRFLDAEVRLASHPAVARAIVMERPDRTGRRHVVGYVLPRAGEHPTARELRRFAKQELPSASVPGVVILLESLAGDADLSHLHDPFALEEDHIAPRTETERTVATIWKEALGVERVSVRDNFLDIGGHSLLAVRAVVRIDRATGVRLNQSILLKQTLEQVAAEVDRQLSVRPNEGRRDDPIANLAQSRPESPMGLFRSLRNAVAGRGQ